MIYFQSVKAIIIYFYSLYKRTIMKNTRKNWTFSPQQKKPHKGSLCGHSKLKPHKKSSTVFPPPARLTDLGHTPSVREISCSKNAGYKTQSTQQ